MGSTQYGHQICTRAFSLAIGRNDYLLSIGWKGRVLVSWKKTCKTTSDLSYETLHEMVRKQTVDVRNQRENLQQTIREQTYK